MGNEDCGQFYHSIGELQKAYESFSRMRPDVSTNKHVVDISRHLINVAIEQRNWLAVNGNVTKIQVMASNSTEAKNLLPFANAGAGLANMAMEKYYEAASSFLAVEPSLGLAYNHTISPNDIAIYGGLCALASMDRKQLQTKVLENSSFRTFLELEPHIRRAIQYFVNGRYASCLSIIQNYHNDFLLDINLWPHVSNIYQKIKTKSIIQYFIPFSCVTIDSLVEALGLQGENIEDELLNMMKSGALEARVDTINRVS
jgi:COP9 signalosome complex subunit 1